GAKRQIDLAGLVEPRAALQRVGNGMSEAVLIADVPEKTRFLDVLAEHGERQDRARESAAGFEHGFQLVRTQALAALNAAGIGQDDVNEFDIRVLLEEGVELAQRLTFSLRIEHRSPMFKPTLRRRVSGPPRGIVRRASNDRPPRD